MLQHMVWTLDNQGEYGVEQLKGISKKWTDAMDISEDTATVMAANKTAYELAVGEIGSTDYDFSDLRESIDNAVASAVEGWAELPAATQNLSCRLSRWRRNVVYRSQRDLQMELQAVR